MHEGEEGTAYSVLEPGQPADFRGAGDRRCCQGPDSRKFAVAAGAAAAFEDVDAMFAVLSIDVWMVDDGT